MPFHEPLPKRRLVTGLHEFHDVLGKSADHLGVVFVCEAVDQLRRYRRYLLESLNESPGATQETLKDKRQRIWFLVGLLVDPVRPSKEIQQVSVNSKVPGG